MPHMSTAEIFRIPKHAAFTWKNNSESSKRRLEVMKMKTEKLLYSRAETARSLGVSLVQLWRLTDAGKLVPKHVGRRVLYPVNELHRFIASAK